MAGLKSRDSQEIDWHELREDDYVIRVLEEGKLDWGGHWGVYVVEGVDHDTGEITFGWKYSNVDKPQTLRETRWIGARILVGLPRPEPKITHNEYGEVCP